MDKQIKGKFMILLIIGIVLMGIVLNNFFGGKKKEFEDMTTTEENVDVDGEKLTNNLDKSIQNDETNETNSNNQENSNVDSMDEYQTIYDEFNYQAMYEEKYGKETMDTIYQKTKEVANLWFDRSVDWDKWSTYVTPSYLKVLKSTSSEFGEKINVNAIDIFPTQSDEEDTMVIGAIATFDDKSEVIEVMFRKNESNYVVDGIVVTWSE